MKYFILILMSFNTGSYSFAAKDIKDTKEDNKISKAPSVKIKAPTKAENFDSQLVEGQVYRPDLSVVTGDTDSNSFGVIRLRANFNDHSKLEKGEAIK